MRKINRIVIHCSATKVTDDYTPEKLLKDHLARGFRTYGYHYYIRKDGTLVPMRPLSEMGAHAEGYNTNSIGICYEGGLDSAGKPADTRTEEQKRSMLELLEELTGTYPIQHLNGHRDLSPDTDGNGIVEPKEWTKQCPCFDVEEAFKNEIQLCVCVEKT
jgi:N-acetylmuramoyl-L-alanine amidase